ncbi:hypothetical protein BGZ58_004637 [Dissophora ornata]|nr:hypothetical protein BGZ58_004637 [Dissophora ornata]
MTLADQSDLHSISSYRARLKFFARSMAPDSLFKWILTTGPISSDVTNATEVLDLKFRNDKFRASQTIKEWILSGPKVGKERSPQQQLREYAQSPEIERWKKDGYTISPHSFVEP